MPAPIIVVNDVETLYYAEFVPASSGTISGTTAMVGLCTVLPNDGIELGATNSIAYRASGEIIANGGAVKTVATYTDADVIGVGLRVNLEDPAAPAITVEFYKNGTLVSDFNYLTYLRGGPSFAVSVQNNTADTITITGRFAEADWTNAPVGATSRSASMVFVDENTVTLTGSGLIVNEGTVANHTPCRASLSLPF